MSGEKIRYTGPEENTVRQYLEGQMSESEKREFEEMFTEDKFSGDAVEGLLEINDAKELDRIQFRLQQMLKKKTRQKNRRKRNPIFFPGWLMIAIFVLLLIMFAGYMIVKWLG